MLGLGHRREFFGGQGLQGEAGLARLHGQALVGKGDRHFAGIRQGAQDVEQLAGRDRGGRGLATRTDVSVRGDLHFDVGGQERHLLAVLANENIGQNRQCVPTLDNTTHDLQRTQERVSLGFNQLHSQFVLANSGLKGAVGRRSVMPMSRVFLLW